MDASGGSVQRTIAYGMSKTKLTKSISQSPVISQEKVRPTGPKGASSRALDP